MKLDITKITGYKEGMTAEEQLKLVLNHDIDMSGYVKKDVADKYASEAADFKKKYTATLSESERKDTEAADRFKEMETELASLKREKTISKYTADYIALGFDKKLADETAAALADGKNDVVFENMAKHQKNLESKLKGELLQNTPKPGASAASTGGVDYAAQAKAALDKGDYTAGAYYTRLAQQANE